MNYFQLSARDFDRKFNDSILLLNGSIYRHDRITDGGPNRTISGLLHGEVWEPYSLSLNADAPPSFDVSFPALGYVNYEGGTVYVTRTAGRQWKVGYHRSVVSLSDRWADARRRIGANITSDARENITFIKKLFSPAFSSYEEAIALLQSYTAISVAVSPVIAIGRDLRSSNFVISYKECIVGYVDVGVHGNVAHLYNIADYVSLLCPFDTIIDPT